MSTSKKALLGVAAVAVIAIGYFAIKGYPPVGDGAAGTVGAAKKYQSEQISDKDVVLKDADAEGGATCTLHLLRGGRYAGRVGGVAATASGGPWIKAGLLVVRLYFPESIDGGEAGRPGGVDEGVDIDWRLVSSFVRKYRDEVSVLDVDECASPADAEERLRVLVQAALAGPGRTVAR